MDNKYVFGGKYAELDNGFMDIRSNDEFTFVESYLIRVQK